MSKPTLGKGPAPTDSAADAQAVLLRQDEGGGVVTLTINRPTKHNALNRSVLEALREELAHIRGQLDEVGCVLLTGAGERAFSAGNDIKSDTPSDALANEVLSAIEALPQPVVCLVNGFVYTGALELVAACDLAMASESATFQDTHAKLALVPTWGGAFRLPRRIGVAQAKHLMFTGERMSAADALRVGLVVRVTPGPAANLRAAGLALARSICANNRRAIAKQKRMINAGWRHSLQTSLDVLAHDQFHPGHELDGVTVAAKL